MSLLMQALKKAESAKQKQDPGTTGGAAITDDTLQASESGALSLQPQEPSLYETPIDATASAVGQHRGTTETKPIDYFSGDMRAPESHYSTFGMEQNAADPKQAFSQGDSRAAIDEKAQDEPAFQGRLPPKLKIGTIEQKAPAKGLAERDRARSVFASKKIPRNRRPIVIAILGLVVLTAVGVYGYIQLMNITQTPPLAAVTQPPGPAISVADAPLSPAPDTAISSDLPASPASPSPQQELPITTPPSHSNPSADFGVAPQATPTAISPSSTHVAQTPPPTPKQPAASAQSTQPVTRAISENPPIKIEKTSGSQQINPTLTAAYQSFLSGDVGSAQTEYQRVLQQDSNNRDALLGLAAIAANRGQTDRAGSFYTRVLELNPADADAAAGLASIRSGDASQTESGLKKILAQNPESGSVLFALGNVYAQQSRWSEAQQAYFRAFGVTPTSADYAFNLAVSLDKLSQGRLALEYYQRSLQLAKQGGGNVNQDILRERIKELTK